MLTVEDLDHEETLAAISPRYNPKKEGASSMIELDKDEVAPSYIKFYKYEEIKAKSKDLMTSKDKLRMKMHEKMKKL